MCVCAFVCVCDAQECLVEERDYTGRLTLEQLETLIAPLIERMTAPVEQALRDAAVTLEQLDAIEIVGGATRYVHNVFTYSNAVSHICMYIYMYMCIYIYVYV